ncbi:Nitrilotriacetate monooxygenase component A/pristinamycin IIA synthase subunit A, partial [Penicillium sp. IBT 16267x]
YFSLNTRHILDPSPQRTPFLIRAEAIFVSSHSSEILRPKFEKIRKQAAELGRDPQSIKFFGTVTPIIGRTDKEAQEKHEELKKYASVVGGLVLSGGWTGIDISNIPLDEEITTADSLEAWKVTSFLDPLLKTSKEVPRWTPRIVAEKAAIGSFGPLAIGSPQTVADEMERWIREADLDGFSIGYVTTRRGLYPEALPDSEERLTAREKIYGRGQKE